MTKAGGALTGIYHHTIDSKNRIFIPVRLREELGDVFYVTLSMEKCLSGYTPEAWERMKEKMREMPMASRKKMRPIFAHASKCELDSQGRILLPQHLREFAELEKNVTVVGVDECVEFWDSENWSAVDEAETTPENIREVLTELDF